MMKLKLSVLLCIILSSFAFAQGSQSHSPDALMLRFPDISSEKIVFVYAGNIWTVPKSGGIAAKLTSIPGQERFPKFSPDGKRISFTANYDGNNEVYIMPSHGGVPKRLTFHPSSDMVLEWYPDGENILFKSRRTAPLQRFNKLYKVSTKGGFVEELPLLYGEVVTFNQDASKMVFQILSREFRTWKRYRGGMASDLWLYDFKKNHSEKLTTFNGTDALPMWHGTKVYFLSDRDENKKLNIWSIDIASKKIEQITFFDEYDVKWPSLGNEDIVFENGGKLHVLNLNTLKSNTVNVVVPDDLPNIRSQQKDFSKNITSFNLSPKGNRAVFGARGDIVTVPKKNGSQYNITSNSKYAERYPTYSNNGKYIAYLSDKSGEYEIYLRNTKDNSERKLSDIGEGYKYEPNWSPDDKYMALSDKAGKLYLVDVESGDHELIDKNEVQPYINFDWSADSKWIAYDKHNVNGYRSIWIYNVEKNETKKITSDFYHESYPQFDPEGKYLYFYSSRTFKPEYSDFDPTWIYTKSSDLCAVTLSSETPSPLAPESDEVEIKEEKKKDDKEKKEEKKDEKKSEMKIDFADIEKRIVKIEHLGNVGTLEALKGKVLYVVRNSSSSSGPSGTLKYYDLKKRKSEKIISGISGFTVSSDEKNILYSAGRSYGIIPVAKGKKVGDGKIKTSPMNFFINPKVEWNQIFEDAWRLERDYFYVPTMHGVDWEAIKERYSKLLPYLSDREDLNYVIGEMIGELNVSHSYVGGGDIETASRLNIGLLGCDFKLNNGYFQISQIYEGAEWDGTDARSPLKEPGLSINEGDYLISVNGKSLDINLEPWAALQGLSGETVIIKVNSKPSEEGAKEFTIVPGRSESRLRYLDWVNENRLKVEKATGGKAGYIYVPNTGILGQTELYRQFLAQYKKDALIVDERFNGGGQIPDRFIELLNRPMYNFWARQDFKDWQTPAVSNVGPKVMLMNGWSGSGGDAFPFYFKKAGLGPLVGKRTWGGLVGYTGTPRPVDGGFLSVPSFGLWNTEGEWQIEGYGVDPDYDVENYPHELAKGNDQQLNKAIDLIKEALKKNPPVKLNKPESPDRSK